MKPRLAQPGERTCAVCGTVGQWGPGWEWYGSLAVVEDCGCRLNTCSPECRADPRAAALVAQYDREHYAGHHRRARQ